MPRRRTRQDGVVFYCGRGREQFNYLLVEECAIGCGGSEVCVATTRFMTFYYIRWNYIGISLVIGIINSSLASLLRRWHSFVVGASDLLDRIAVSDRIAGVH